MLSHFMLKTNGAILENGSHAQLMQLDGRYAELFNLQAEAYR